MSVLAKIVSKLLGEQDDDQGDTIRNYASTIFQLTQTLEHNLPSAEEFTTFLTQTHDLLITGDSSKRCSILRTIRYSLSEESHIHVLITLRVHWAIILSLEREGDNTIERVQALKITEKVRQLCPSLYPIAFARSVVAIANSKEDPIRKICIESLKDLALMNPPLVAAVDGFAPLMEAIIEPVSSSMADSILLTLIYLLNDPSTRAIVGNFIDLRNLLIPFTDLDSTVSELMPKWHACKNAIVLLMRSWVGIVQLGADDMAWSTLIRMLRDPKVPPASQEAILDVIIAVFNPVISRISATSSSISSRPKWQQQQQSANWDSENNKTDKLGTHPSASSSKNNLTSNSGSGRSNENIGGSTVSETLQQQANAVAAAAELEATGSGNNGGGANSSSGSSDKKITLTRADSDSAFNKSSLTSGTGSVSTSSWMGATTSNTTTAGSAASATSAVADSDKIASSNNTSRSSLISTRHSYFASNNTVTASTTTIKRSSLKNVFGTPPKASSTSGKYRTGSVLASNNTSNGVDPQQRLSFSADTRTSEAGGSAASSTTSTNTTSGASHRFSLSGLFSTSRSSMSSSSVINHNNSSNSSSHAATNNNTHHIHGIADVGNSSSMDMSGIEEELTHSNHSHGSSERSTHHVNASGAVAGGDSNSIASSNSNNSLLRRLSIKRKKSLTAVTFDQSSNNSSSNNLNNNYYSDSPSENGSNVDLQQLAAKDNYNNNINNSNTNHIVIDDLPTDYIFNMMDNYAALLCCLFLHADLIPSLYFLGIHGHFLIAQKSRQLMVHFLRKLAAIFPETLCSELLSIPSLIEFAASVSTSKSTKRAHMSSQTLIALAQAFTVMPFKQAGGLHISGLSTNYANSNSANTPTSSSSIERRRSTNSSSVSSSQALAANTTATALTRSNFPPLNIQTVFELAEELKITSFSTISGGVRDICMQQMDDNLYRAGLIVDLPNNNNNNNPTNSSNNNNKGNGSSLMYSSSSGGGGGWDVLNTLRYYLTPEIDKNDFNRQMDQSRVISKDGKEPFKWDWMTISDMLEYSFFHSSRLAEALKTKWIRRVSGFYRCSAEEKGYFANLEWDPVHLQYLECAVRMYSVLLKDEAGVNFLLSDRRGMLFNEIANEVAQLTMAAASTTVTAQSFSLQRNVFRLFSCQCSMAREFFALVGRIVVHESGSQHLLRATNVFPNLLKLGQYRSLDYASRLVLTSLSFTDGGVLSSRLMQQWMVKGSCTVMLRRYIHSLLRILLRPSALGSVTGGTFGTNVMTSGVAASAGAGADAGVGGGSGSGSGQTASNNNWTNRFSITHRSSIAAASSSPSSTPPPPPPLLLLGESAGDMYGMDRASFAWRIEAVAEQLGGNPVTHSSILYKALEEALHDRANLRTIVARCPPGIVEDPRAQRVLLSFLGIPEGIRFLSSNTSAMSTVTAAAAAAAGGTNPHQSKELSSSSSSSSSASSSSTDIRSGANDDSNLGEGVHVKPNSWLNNALNTWHATKCAAYARDVDERLTLAFAQSDGKLEPVGNEPSLQYVRRFQPIPVQTVSFLDDLQSATSSSTTGVSAAGEISSRYGQFSSGSHRQSPHSTGAASAQPSVDQQHAGGGATPQQTSPIIPDLQGLVRIPWNIEVKVTNSLTTVAGSSNNSSAYTTSSTSNGRAARHSPGAGVPRSRESFSGAYGGGGGLSSQYGSSLRHQNSTSSITFNSSGGSTGADATGGLSSMSSAMLQTLAGEYLKMDSFLDVSDMASALCYETTSDPSNLIKVRGIVLDNRGFASGFAVPYNKIVSSTLLAGVCPVTRAGRVLPAGRVKIPRRKASAAETLGAREAVTRMSQSSSMNGGLGGGAASSGGGGGGGGGGSGHGGVAGGGGGSGQDLGTGSSAGDIDGLIGATSAYDLPISFQLEAPYDWSNCKPAHRQNHTTDLGDGKFSVAVAGEPVVFVFTRRSPNHLNAQSSTSRMSRAGSLGGLKELDNAEMAAISANASARSSGNNSGGTGTGTSSSSGSGSGHHNHSSTHYNSGNRSAGGGGGGGGLVYLLEVQYFLRLETGYSIHVPMPPHLYGSLSNTREGCGILSQRKLVNHLLVRAKDCYAAVTVTTRDIVAHGKTAVSAAATATGAVVAVTTETAAAASDELQSVLWALGHIGANELGYALIAQADSITNITNNSTNISSNSNNGGGMGFLEWCVTAASECASYSLRGTFFYVLGLLGTTYQGNRRLRKLGWDSITRGGGSAVAFPLKPSVLFRSNFSVHNGFFASSSSSSSSSTQLSLSQSQSTTRGRSSSSGTPASTKVPFTARKAVAATATATATAEVDQSASAANASAAIPTTSPVVATTTTASASATNPAVVINNCTTTAIINTALDNAPTVDAVVGSGLAAVIPSTEKDSSALDLTATATAPTLAPTSASGDYHKDDITPDEIASPTSSGVVPASATGGGSGSGSATSSGVPDKGTGTAAAAAAAAGVPIRTRHQSNHGTKPAQATQAEHIGQELHGEGDLAAAATADAQGSISQVGSSDLSSLPSNDSISSACTISTTDTTGTTRLGGVYAGVTANRSPLYTAVESGTAAAQVAQRNLIAAATTASAGSAGVDADAGGGVTSTRTAELSADATIGYSLEESSNTKKNKDAETADAVNAANSTNTITSAAGLSLVLPPSPPPRPSDTGGTGRTGGTGGGIEASTATSGASPSCSTPEGGAGVAVDIDINWEDGKESAGVGMAQVGPLVHLQRRFTTLAADITDHLQVTRPPDPAAMAAAGVDRSNRKSSSGRISQSNNSATTNKTTSTSTTNAAGIKPQSPPLPPPPGTAGAGAGAGGLMQEVNAYSQETKQPKLDTETNIELEVLNLIAKLPGVIVYRDSKSQLDQLRRQNESLFSRSTLYHQAHRMLESYTFKLAARRDILAMFSDAAKAESIREAAAEAAKAESILRMQLQQKKKQELLEQQELLGAADSTAAAAIAIAVGDGGLNYVAGSENMEGAVSF